MTHSPKRGLRFGAMMAPWHKPNLSPNASLHRDLDLIERLDAWGYDEIWVGEHHSGGVETVSSPELMLAAAAMRTSRIKLGTGVISLPYHHPFMVAERIAMLDHLSRGRVMMGVGPGQLPEDSRMIGINPIGNRAKLEIALSVVTRLLRGETVTELTDWFVVDEASLQIPPYSEVEIAVTAVGSPTGPKLAGRLGASILSLGATDPSAIKLLHEHWAIAEAEAAAHGNVMSRSSWRLVGPMHVAESEKQARKDMEYGLTYLMNYLAHLVPGGGGPYTDTNALIDNLNASGAACIGTPDMAVAQIKRLQEMSGGFGCYLNLQADFVPYAANVRSYELIAEEVMPHFDGSLTALQGSYDAVMGSDHAGAKVTATAQEEARTRYESETRSRLATS